MSVVNVKFYLSDEKAKQPTKGSENAAGFDLTCTSILFEEDDDFLVKVGTGVHAEIPVGYYGMLVPRSSIYKKDLILANSVGIVDSDYRGEIKLFFKSLHKTITLDACMSLLGERIGQLLILPLPQVVMSPIGSLEELSSTERGEGGFGSTGSK